MRKCDLVVLLSWPVENRWIFKEQVLTFFFMLLIKLQTVLLARVILIFSPNWLYKCNISCITDRKTELQETGRATSTWKSVVCTT